MRLRLPALVSLAPILLLGGGCFEDPTVGNNDEVGDGDGDTSGDGDGDPSTGDGDPSTGDGDGDPSTGDGDGDPSTGDGDGDPSTGDGDGDPNACNDEFIVADFFMGACDQGQWWTYDGQGDSHDIACNSEPPGTNMDGWGRQLDPAMAVEGGPNVPKALEIGSWPLAGGYTGVDFNSLMISDLCQPRLKVSVGCGYQAACEIEYRVQIKDNALPFDAPPLYEEVAVPVFDGTLTNVDIDLVPYQNKVINVTLMVYNQNFDPADIIVFGWPRIVALQ